MKQCTPKVISVCNVNKYIYINFIYVVVPQRGKYHCKLKVFLMKILEAWKIVFP